MQNTWTRIAGSLYARVERDGYVSLREWESPRAPVWTSTVWRILSAVEGTDDNVTFGGGQGDGAGVTVQRADLADLAAFLRSLLRR